MDFKILETLILTCQNELDNTCGEDSALDALQSHLQDKYDQGSSEDPTLGLTNDQALLLHWLNLLIMDRKAADLYLEHWQLGEAPIVDPEDAHDFDRKRNRIAGELKDMGYPDPETIVFDNEAVPHIYFKNPSFNCTTYYESLLSTDDEE